MKRGALGGRIASVAGNVSGRGFKLALFGGVSALTAASLALANPQGGEVVQGAATITTPNTVTTQVDQSSDKAIINWQSFNVGQGESAIFKQPNAASVTLNRIFDQDPSIIAGLVSANGRLILINANGMVFENGATVNTAGLIATTADISNNDFMAGNMRFETPGAANASIVNKGMITAEEGGVVAFVAPSVRNSGVITAKLGRVALGAGNTFVLDLYGDNLISFPVSAEIAEQLTGPDGKPLSALIEAGGKIEAGTVQLTARAARGIIDNVINVDGEIIASGVKQSGGSTFLTAGTFDPTNTSMRLNDRAMSQADSIASGGAAGGVHGSYGGRIVIDGGQNNVNLAGSLSASGAAGGGSIAVSGNNVYAGGSISANGGSGQGGSVAINASNFAALSGSISANGASGGSVNVNAGNLLTAGSVSADGSSGKGGTISLTAQQRQIATASTQVSASGAAGGGSITVAGGAGEDGGVFTSGSYRATSSSGAGGSVTVAGRDIKMIDSKVDASGATAGGNISVGFTGAGDARAINADQILVSPSSTFSADATQSGDGGSVVFWSNLATDFMGTITAKGGSISGDGGFLEVSSKGDVGFWGLGDASAANGASGQLLLDPKNIVVSTAGSMMPSYELIDPGTGSTSFGANLAVLANGNTVVTSTGNDTVANNAGAVFVFNTTTGALISMLTGSRADDAIGSGGITVLSSGNFVVASANWDNGAGALDAGAVTYINGTTGLAGVVSSANSLVGGAANMNVGSGGVTVLTNGNYVVASPNWDNGGTANVGAVTLGDGANGTFGTVSAANSLVGSQTTDNVGSGGVVALSNGNYVVRSMLWNNGGVADAGAVTWRSGTNFTGLTVAAANSLVGSTANDQVGSNGVTALNNGNYVVASSLWNNGGTADVGAATWVNGGTGVTSNATNIISAANSFIGGGDNDLVGSGGVVALSNGNYVIVSPSWDGAGTNRGAATWGNGAAGTSGTVGIGNSVFGSTDNDGVGSGGVVALTNGNFAVVSPNFDAGTGTQHGAVTWRSGAAASAVAVAAANSLVGSNSGDQVGSGGVRALTNGNYVVASPLWNNGATADVGAATWVNGATGATSNATNTISATNSFIGGGDNDLVGSGGIVALTNGNYVIVSPSWDGAGTNRGAATWGNGAAGTAGTVGTINSIVGSTNDDAVANGGVVALTNGNYVVISPNWNNGGDTDTGAVTWASGTAATAATVSGANSLIGTNDDDNVGSGGVVALANGNYVVSSPNMDFGANNNAGAVTLGIGTGGTVGDVTTTNSLTGNEDDDEFRYAGLGSSGEIVARSLPDGEVLVGLTDPNQLTFARAQAATLTVNPAFLTRTLNTGTAVTLQASNDLTVSNDIIVNNPSGNGGALTLSAGRSVLLNADITTDNGNLTIIANELLAAGVINAQRDAGSAVITMAAGADINAGTGNVVMRIASGAGKTNLASGDLTLRNVTGGSILAENLGTTAGSDIIIASGALNASGAGTPLVLASQVGNFINNAGAAALQAPNGRWIVYSQTPTANTIGGLAGSPYYNTPYNPADPTGLVATGNRFAYTIAPVLTVNAGNQSREYGEPNSSLTYTVTGLLGTDTQAGAVQGAPVIDTTATQTSAAGGVHPITVTGLGTLASDYNYGFAIGGGGLLTITQAQLFYLADLKSREYGDPNGSITGVVSGLKNGELLEDVTDGAATFSTLANNFSNVGSYAITGTGLTVTNGNYVVSVQQAASNATALTVVPAQLTYVANPVSREYGEFNPPTIDGLVTGLKNGQDLDDVVDGLLAFDTSIPIDETTNAGVYGILGAGLTVTDSNYAVNIVQAAGNATAFTIVPAQLYYRAFASSRIYGDPENAYDGEIIGLKLDQTLDSVTDGTAAFATTATATSNVGQHAINGSGLTVVNGNYQLVIQQEAPNATALEITPAQLTYLADVATRAYGDANPTFTGQLVGLKNGEQAGDIASGTMTFTTSATATSNVGEYDILGGGLTVTSGNYFTVIDQDPSNSTALFIDQAQLFYLSDSKSRIYGDANPELTGTVSGLRNGETLDDITDGTLGFVTNAFEGSDVGSYEIAGEGLTVVNSNYRATVEQAASNETALTITPAQLTYLAGSVSRIYGDANPDLFDGEVLGLKNGETLDSVTDGDLTFITGASETSNVGSYAINGDGLTVINGNYITNIVQDPTNATALTITPAQLTYIANATTREYGDPNPTFTGELAGLKNGEQIADVASGTMTFTSPATQGSSLGLYAINGGGLTVTSGNYFVAIDQDATNAEALTITPAQLTYLADIKSKIYGQNNPAFTGSVTGLKNGDALEAVTDGTLAWVSAAIDISGAGIYGVFGEGLTVTSGNYLIDILQAPTNDGAFTINQAQLTYVADPKKRIFGFPDPAFTGTVIGVAGNDSLDNVVLGDLVFTSPATGSSLPGFYAINGGGLTVANPNYFSTILQDPGNAAAFEIIEIPLTGLQALQESTHAGQSTVDQEQDSMSSRSNELNIEGTAPPATDMDDGKNDDLINQLCVLGAPEAANAPGCVTNKQAK